MIDSRTIVTYAQYNEDLILAALFYDVARGFYVDLGANYADVDSVTKYFYDRGWRGINVEPIESLHRQLEKSRPEDINLQCGVDTKEGTAVFREYVDLPGHSTFDNTQKQAHRNKQAYKEYEVVVKPLVKIFEDNKVHKAHFLKIDVEGYEYHVISSNDWHKYRPQVVCIEANHVSRDWRPILQSNKYRLFITDGLNEYYVAEEAWGRTDGFAERAVVLDYHALKQHHFAAWNADIKQLSVLRNHARKREIIIQKLLEENALSMKNRSFKRRVRLAFIGLTSDWMAYRRSQHIR